MFRPNHTAPFLALLLITLLTLVGCAAPESNEHANQVHEAPPAPEPVVEEKPASATAILEGRIGTDVKGRVQFTEVEGGVKIVADIEGLTAAGSHGFHIHQVGDCSSEDFKSAGGHFNPAEVDHAGPEAAEHHLGDLGNIEIGEDGSGHLELVAGCTESGACLTIAEGSGAVVGRGVILHEGTDDLTSQPTGAAGARLACGVVALDTM